MTKRNAPRGWKRSLPALLSFALAVAMLGIGLAMTTPRSTDEAGIIPSQDAASVFQTSCAACHTIGGGDGIGPDLEGVATRRDRDWLVSWITDPVAMVESGDPTATELLATWNNFQMPTLGLPAADVEALVDYLGASAGTAAPAPVTTQPVAAGSGDVAAGRNLFTGANTLDNGGPSCRACHSIAGIGALGGGQLGPDLTTSYQRLGEAMITWPQTGTMQPIFTDKPLTAAEQADLLAFFSSTDVTERAPEVIWQLAGLALAGVAIIAILAQLIWRRRLARVRGPMVAGRK